MPALLIVATFLFHLAVFQQALVCIWLDRNHNLEHASGKRELRFSFGEVSKFEIYSPMNFLRDRFDQLESLKNNIVKGARRGLFKFFDVLGNILELLFRGWRIK